MQKEVESEREVDVDQERAIAGVVEGFIEAYENLADAQAHTLQAHLELIGQLERGESPTTEGLALKRQIVEEHLRILDEHRDHPAQVRVALRLHR